MTWTDLTKGQGKLRLPLLSPRDGYDRWADSYGVKPTVVQTLESPALFDMMPDLAGKIVLDLGCGRGRIAATAIKQDAKETIGLDLSAQMLRLAVDSNESSRSFWLAGDCIDLPFKTQSFDVIVSGLMMGHVEDLEGTINQIDRVLRPGGYLVLSDFHPFATLRGDERSFSNNGKTYAIKQFCHLFEDYYRCFEKYTLHVEELREPQYEGFPLVFVMRTRKLKGTA